MNPQGYSSLRTIGSFNSQVPINDTSQKIQLFISGRSLLDLDVFSKSDPYVKVFYKKSPMHIDQFIGRTQTIPNDLNPNWSNSFLVDYIFETKQQIRFQVFDEDDGKNDDFIGRVVTTIGALAGAKNQTSILELVNPNNNKKVGKLIVRVQSCKQSSQFLRMKWKSRKLMNTDSWFDFWDKSDPYLKFLKVRSDNSFIEAARTEVIMDSLNPDWKAVEVSLGKLLTKPQDFDQKFKIECWDWQQKGQKHHQFIGQIWTTVNQLLRSKLPFEFKLTNPKNKSPGFINLERIELFAKPSFMDYIRGGLQLNLSIAIDFTGSNGIPTHPSSLHYMNPQRPNQYQIAIDAVAKILLDYDSDKCIPAFGFGAKPHFPYFNTSMVSHCFPLSGNPQQIQAFGYDHLMNMYANAIQNVQLSGPTYFAPILRQAINISRMNMQQGSNTYQILLILTDGQIHDMDETIDLLVKNCQLPLSLIIVGVGNAEFTNMQRLDGDNGLYSTKGKKAQRDIVQFVPFREVKMNPDLLAQELLAELPSQVTQYMTMIGKKPNPPIQVNMNDIVIPTNEMKPQQALKNQILNMFQQEPNHFNPQQ